MCILQVSKVHIIPYLEILGNYNQNFSSSSMMNIIPYQEKLRNYNMHLLSRHLNRIIPYQEKLGNYNVPFGYSDITAIQTHGDCVYLPAKKLRSDDDPNP